MKFKMGGSGIHIKPENKGKFTATKKATGKSTEELTHSKNPVTKKRAVFAQNAAKWKHEDGAKKLTTPDSTTHYEGQMKKFMKKRSEVSIDKAPPYDSKVNKAMSDMYRQTKKGKEGYDKNGHPIMMKMQNGSKNTKSFPDLNKDGEITKADILKGRGVIKKTGANSMKVDEKMCGSKGMKYQEGSQKLKISEKNKKDFLKVAKEVKPDYTLLQPKGFKKPSAKDSSDYRQGYINSKEDSWGKNKSQAYIRGQLENRTRTKLNAKSSNTDKKLYDLKNKVDQTVNNFLSYAEGTKSIKFKKKPMMKRADGSTSQRGLYDNIRANKGSGKKPTPEMLKQEKKIKFGK